MVKVTLIKLFSKIVAIKLLILYNEVIDNLIVFLRREFFT